MANYMKRNFVAYAKHPYLRCTKKDLTKLELEQQTIMFWNLQLQFMEMDYRDLSDVYDSVMNKIYWIYPSKEDLATELALHLSGIE